MSYILKANKRYSGYDLQVELDAYPSREAAEQAADALMNTSYIHDECEISRATYVIVEDRTDERQRTVTTVDGNGAETIQAGTEDGGHRSPKRRNPKNSGSAGNRS